MRPPVEILAGNADDAVAGIAADFAMLDATGPAPARVWTCCGEAVVLGVSRDLGAEVREDECARRGAAILRRASGGGTVVIGPGTVQYALLMRHADGAQAPSLDAVRQSGNALVRRALASAGVDREIDADDSGDLRVGARKIGGLAMRRRRHATLLHGTLLVDADLAAISALLRHPAREPAWRRRRHHLDFLANLGPFAVEDFRRALQQATAGSAD